jgi:hypothetical protein
MRERESIEIGECKALDCVLAQLRDLRSRVPNRADAQVTLGGDEIFGWRVNVTYYRELTAEEWALQAKYGASL